MTALLFGVTLKQQATNYASFIGKTSGWSKCACTEIGGLVSEMVGNNKPILSLNRLDGYVREAMRCDGEM